MLGQALAGGLPGVPGPAATVQLLVLDWHESASGVVGARPGYHRAEPADGIT
jgi:hypothetical protein